MCSKRNYDSLAEELVILKERINGNYVVKALSSNQKDWDLICFTLEDEKTYKANYLQVKSVNWDSDSKAINAKFKDIIKRKAFDYLYICIFNLGNSEVVYKIPIDKIKEKSSGEALINKNGEIFFSELNDDRKDKDKQTISLKKLENEEVQKLFEIYLIKLIKE